MKLFAVIMVVAGLCGANALAQSNDQVDLGAPVSLPVSDPIDSMSIAECRTNLRQCLDDLSDQAANYTELLLELARRMGYSSVDEMLAADCRSRRGAWSNGECLCASPSSWYTPETQECCVPSATRYERQIRSCESSGGRYTCRGGCRCPMGTQLLDGRCQGDATTRQEVVDLRIIRDEQVPELEAQIARLEAELAAAREAGEGQAERIAELERQLAETRSQLAAAQSELEFLRSILASEDIEVPDQPNTTPPGPMPGTDEAVAAAVDPSTPNPVTDTVPPSDGETDETWCEANPGLCTVIVIGAAAAAVGLGFGIYEAVRDPADIEASWGYNR